MPTSTVEDYLKQLYLQCREQEEQMVPMGRLAAAMGVVPGTATSMVKALADSGLVVYEPRGGVRLTESGKQLALHVLRRHRLIEVFLVKVLGLDWSMVHDEAEQLEHAVSDNVLERIDALLGHPDVDPHGDPIPSAMGQIDESSHQSLADCEVGVSQQVIRIMDQDAGFLRFVERHGMMPGTQVVVEDREPVAGAVRVAVAGSAPVSLGLQAAAKIRVIPRVT